MMKKKFKLKVKILKKSKILLILVGFFWAFSTETDISCDAKMLQCPKTRQIEPNGQGYKIPGSDFYDKNFLGGLAGL